MSPSILSVPTTGPCLRHTHPSAADTEREINRLKCPAQVSIRLNSISMAMPAHTSKAHGQAETEAFFCLSPILTVCGHSTLASSKMSPSLLHNHELFTYPTPKSHSKSPQIYSLLPIVFESPPASKPVAHWALWSFVYSAAAEGQVSTNKLQTRLNTEIKNSKL